MIDPVNTPPASAKCYWLTTWKYSSARGGMLLAAMEKVGIDTYRQLAAMNGR